MKSDTLFCRLAGIATLLSFDGIVPSVADFQLRLITLIAEFNHSLLDEDQQPNESEGLCRVLCHYFDKRMVSAQQNNAFSWQRYSLVNHFYGFSEDEHAAELLPQQLEVLLNSDSETIFRYAWKLLTLLIQTDDSSEPLIALRTSQRARYAASNRKEKALDLIPNALMSQQPTPTADARLMVFIVGPFASKWFSQSDLSSSSSGEIVWIVVENLSSLINRLHYVEEHHDRMALLAFFPLMVDAYENSEIMAEQITRWQHSFSGTRWPRHLPCLLGLYTRLSQQRSSHDPDSAIWNGGFKNAADPHGKLKSCLFELVSELDIGEDKTDLYAIQRHALGSTLVTWLTESSIMAALQNLFDIIPLDFAGVTLADYGQGFTRHGAWSQWLGQKYGILPSLAPSIAMPPLPPIELPPPVEDIPEPEPVPVPVSEVPPSIPAAAAIVADEPLQVRTPARRRWPAILVLLILCACIAAVFYYISQRQHLQVKTHSLNPISFSLSGSAPLFERGSSKLVPESEKVLSELVPKIRQQSEYKYLIIGHSDNTGTAEVNMALSTARANVIREWLIKNTGLSASHFIVEGAGNTRPVASNDTQQGRAQNRRVEIIPLSLQRQKD